MVFSSITFLFFFLPLALTIYFFPRNRWRNETLLVLSLIFYAWGETEHLLILPISILVNYLFGLGLSLTDPVYSKDGAPIPGSSMGGSDGSGTSTARKLFLAGGIVFNVGLLIFYKYSSFLAENLNPLFRWLDLEPITASRVHAPLGISFFTFHALSYLIDIFRKNATVLKNPLDLAVYISFFPKMLAGPIIRYQDGQKDLRGRCVMAGEFLDGIERFILGLGKKVLIANPLAAVVDKIFDLPAGELTFGVAWLGILCFTLQIFFDFAGYSDMAIGLARMLGFQLPENFNYPYIAQSVQDFWRRWHISLSRWLRDYLYIPLGGNRCSQSRQYLNLITVFLVCGLWHGASWNFVVWGMWYGLFLVLERAGFAAFLASLHRSWRHLYTLFVVVVGWVFFRSETLTISLLYLKSMFGLGSGIGDGQYSPGMFLNNEVVLCLLTGLVFSLPPGMWSDALLRLRPSLRESGSGVLALGVSSVYVAFLGLLFLLSCMALAGGTHKAFIYFRF
jgi:alginate O-acetyltransferase complex protein AlgI